MSWVLVVRFFLYLDRKCSVHLTLFNQQVLVDSDEHEPLVVIKLDRNPRSRQHIHGPFSTIATQCNENTDLEGLRMFERLFCTT